MAGAMERLATVFYVVADNDEYRYDPDEIIICATEVETSIGKLLVALIHEQQEGDFVGLMKDAAVTPRKLDVTGEGLTAT